MAVSASDDKTLKVWDVEKGRELRTLQGHSDVVRGVALSANGRLVVSASDDKTLKVWEVVSGRELCALVGHSDWVRGVAVSSDGRLAVSASADRTVKVWDVVTGTLLANFTCDAGAYCCAFQDDRKLILAGDALGQVHFLRLEQTAAID
jgi:tricorn protease-like protein